MVQLPLPTLSLIGGGILFKHSIKNVRLITLAGRSSEVIKRTFFKD